MDASWKGLHCQLLGDLGWFSHQMLQKDVLMALDGEENLAVNASFEYLAKGREASCDLRFGYQIDFNKKWAILPFTGWLDQNMELFRSNPWPPFDQTSQNVPDPYVLADTSITYLSNWHQIWKGPTLGAEIAYQPWSWLSVGISYGFGWLKYKEAFAEMDRALLYLPGPVASTLMSMICENGHVRSRGHGHIVQGKIHLDFSKSWLFDVFGRYSYYYTGSAHSHSMQKSWSGTVLQSVGQPAKVDQSSFTVGCELGYRF
jgi:hypothetical protein